MSRCRSFRKSLKTGFEKALDSIWKTGDSLPEEPLSELPKTPLSKEQLDSIKDPLDLLIEKEERKQ